MRLGLRGKHVSQTRSANVKCDQLFGVVKDVDHASRNCSYFRKLITVVTQYHLGFLVPSEAREFLVSSPNSEVESVAITLIRMPHGA